MAKELKVGLVGVGLVGKELIEQINLIEGITLVGLMNSKLMKVDNNGINGKDITNILSNENGAKASNIEQFVTELSPKQNENKVLIDCTASEQVSQYYPFWLEQGFHVVTPNKKGFSGNIKLFKLIQANSSLFNRYVYHESTVGAGLPVIETLNNIVRSGDKVTKIEGIFSGTLSYLFNNFSSLKTKSGENFSKIVSVAKELGYTEPDPRDDLNGLDVARKVIILARVAGLELSLEDLEIENIVPEALRGVKSSEEFMDQLKSYDDHFNKLNQDALSNQQVLRYVGVIDPNGQSSVKLLKYDSAHPFANLTGSDNIIAFTTERFPSPLIIQGAGAGALVTVHGILTDLLKILERV
ncbi:hypothetical protein K502DRAFT_339845 [Neoconidiobolus thromboides FSU 785]|nr:hypothetical protein K502DRAFT_339845 [Neoconidiobolus thromboides FSU 785]